MRIYLKTITLLVTLINFSSYAQSEGETNLNGGVNNEVNLNLFSYNNASFVLTNEYSNFLNYTPKVNYVNGLGYRHHFSKSAIRVNAQYALVKFPDGPPKSSDGQFQMYEGKLWYVDFSAGYERRFGKGKIRWVTAMDIAFNGGFTDGILQNAYCDRCEAILYELTHYSLALAPTIGLDYQMSRRIKWRMELNMNFGYQVQTYEAINVRNIYTTDPHFFMSFNPVSNFSVGYCF